MIGLEYFLLGYFLIQPEKSQLAGIFDLLLSLRIGAKRTKNGALVVLKKYRKQLIPMLSSAGVLYSEEKGLPQFIYRNRKRYSAFFALFICFFIFAFLQSRVFEIRIFGASEDVEKTVLSALDTRGVYPGASFRSLDFSEIENSLKETCPSVAWTNVHRRGTVLYVNVIENDTEDFPTENVLANLVASEDCVIVSVSPNSGVPYVKVGDAVKAGDLLIGAIHKDGTISGASGEVLGRVHGEIYVEAACRETKITVHRQRNAEITLNFFGFSINIFKNYRNLPNDCDIIENKRTLRLLGRASLPISLSVKTAYLSEKETRILTEEETVRLAEVRLRASISELLSEGEMIRMQTEGNFTENGYAFTLRYTQIRNVAEPKPIRTDENN